MRNWLCVVTAILLLCSGCHDKTPTVTAYNGDLLRIVDSTYQSGTGWGYKVYVGDRLYVNQPFIPGVPGKRYFVTEDDAQKVATLVVQKIAKHEIPPTVTGNELRQLNIIK